MNGHRAEARPAVMQSRGKGEERPLDHIKGSNYYDASFVSPVEKIKEIDSRDKGTPDEWVPRHPELVRLTGRHPFNVEPPVTRLLDHGFITPASLHYVRNHGAVPRLDWTSHRVRVSGRVGRPLELSMDQLLRTFESVTIPVTLVCAGNRRKEQNMVKQGLGFSWGPAAVSNSLWTGVWLRDILAAAGIQSFADGARHVCMAGADKLPNGSYGTSIRREVAMDPTADVLVAYKQNGEWLEPDHGFPVRIIIPGYIGGRMIKWLTDIIVTPAESDNHYHYFDNRVLPPQVTAERAAAEDWWHKPQYIINELNINSAIVYPAHGESLRLNGPGAAAVTDTYTVRGYAYAGGGIAITRVEVSLDGGETWELAELQIPERPRHMGRYWCWVFWEFPVEVLRLVGCRDIVCRAWQGQNTQPGNLTWSVLGMMNNCWFRVKVNPARLAADPTAVGDAAAGGSALALSFEHPTQPGQQPGGWMNPEPVDTGAATAAAAKYALAQVPAPPAAANCYTMEEVAEHDSAEDCWIVVDGHVYDVTPFLKDHPGGAESITLCAGEDATEEFNALHSDKARAMLADYLIGSVATEKAAVPVAPAVVAHVTVVPVATAPSNGAALANANGASKINGAVPKLTGFAGFAVANGAADTDGHSATGGHSATNGHAATNGHGCPVAVNRGGASSTSAVRPAPVLLESKKKFALPLAEKEVLTHNSRRFRFALPTPEHVLGLPVGKHVFVSGKRKGTTEFVMRAYTPATGDELKGFVDLVVKVYKPCERFPQGGKMSQLLDELEIGETVDFKGPLGEITYLGDSAFDVKGRLRHFPCVAMLAGGTGITPMYQVIRAVLADPADGTALSLVYANQSEDDILLRGELDALVARHPDRFRVWYTIDKPNDPAAWKFSVGFIDEEMLRAHLPEAGEGSVALMCGPPPMLKFACVPNLQKMGYTEDQFFNF